MARVVSYGLIVATILTLVVVPVLYSLLDDVTKFISTRILRRSAVAALVMGLGVALTMMPQELKAQLELVLNEQLTRRSRLIGAGLKEVEDKEMNASTKQQQLAAEDGVVGLGVGEDDQVKDLSGLASVDADHAGERDAIARASGCAAVR